MERRRLHLYERLPEIYRIKDADKEQLEQLKNYISLFEEALGAVLESIESLYDDLFIETCSDWVIPYIADLLGTSHLKGSTASARADVADTIQLRRRKGTLGGIELLTYNLTRWGVHCAELRDNLVWNQHLNHQRPDCGGEPPYGDGRYGISTVVRGGTVTLRDPAVLGLLDTPFDPFAHIADLRPPAPGNKRYNIPNLAIFLWRLKDYCIKAARPVTKGVHPGIDPGNGNATHVACFIVDPIGRPIKLFNTYRFNPDREPLEVTEIDETPGPIPVARLSSGTEAGRPEKYVSVSTYDAQNPDTKKLDGQDRCLNLFLPENMFSGEEYNGDDKTAWTIRGANLCAWEKGLREQVKQNEIVVDPKIGRLLIGVSSVDRAKALEDHLLVTHTYGAVGPVGAHPKSRPEKPKEWQGEPIMHKVVSCADGPDALAVALQEYQDSDKPYVIEIADNMVHDLNLNSPVLTGTVDEEGGPNIRMKKTLIIRAANDRRPIVRLKVPLRFRPFNNNEADGLTLRLEGLHITRLDTLDPKEPLIARASVGRVEVVDSTLDPGGGRMLNGTEEGTRTQMARSMQLRESSVSGMKTVPEVVIQQSVTGALLIDSGYTLTLLDSIVDAGVSPGADEKRLAVTNATKPKEGWAPETYISNVTVLGGMRVEEIGGSGGIWTGPLEVHNNQVGCIRYSYFSGKDDRLPQTLGCVKGGGLSFTSTTFGDPAYCQLSFSADRAIREEGPQRTPIERPEGAPSAVHTIDYSIEGASGGAYKLGDQMGAYNFLCEAHKWRNIQIRYREFMPVGVRPLLIPVT